MIVASITGEKLEEIIVEKGSDEEKTLKTKCAGCGYSLPALEVDGEFITQTSAILSFLAADIPLCGNNAFENAQIDQWVEFIRTKTIPLKSAVSLAAFGQIELDEDEHKYMMD